MRQTEAVTEQAVHLLGYFSRVQTMVELLIQLRLRQLPDVLDGLGAGYFNQLSDASRKRWLKSLGTSAMNSSLGSRLETVYVLVAEVRNHISHSPLNFHLSAESSSTGIRFGSTKWIDRPPPSDREIANAQAQLEWLEQWIIWMIVQIEAVEPFVKRKGKWETLKPKRPAITPPE